jgi:DNA modification methylase
MQPITAFLNQIIHGDCIPIMRTMPDASVDLVLTDPPYLVNYRTRDGRQHENDKNDHWLLPAFREIQRVLKPDCFCVSFYGWPWIDRFMGAWKQNGLRPVSHFALVKSYCSREGYTRSYHEVAYLLAKGKPARPAHAVSDVLDWGEYTNNTLHPTQKSVSGLLPLIEAFSKPGEIVLDPFAGSGSTAVAARAHHRRFILIEIDERHCKTAHARLTQPSLAQVRS